MKLTQLELIKNSFIVFYLKQYKDKGPHAPHEDLFKIMDKPSFYDGLSIKNLKTNPLTGSSNPKGTKNDYVMDAEHEMLLARKHYFTPLLTTGSDNTYTEDVTSRPYPSVDDVPYELVDKVFKIQGEEDEKPSFVIIVREDFEDLSPEEQLDKVIEIFKEGSQVEFPDSQTVGGLTVNKGNSFKYDSKTGKLTVTTPGVSGEIEILIEPRMMTVGGRHIETIRLRPEEGSSRSL